MYHNIRFQHDLTKQFFYGSHQSTDQNTNRIIIKDIDWEESAEEGWINTGQSYLHRRDYISPNKVSHIPQSQLITESIRYALNSTRILHTGRAFGSVHPQHPAYRSSLDTVMKNLNISRLILPRLFAIEVTEITNLEHQSLENQDLEKQNLAQQNLEKTSSYNVFRTQTSSDAVFMTKSFAERNRVGVGFMTAGTHVWSLEGTNNDGTQYVAASHAPISSLLDPSNYDNILHHIVAKFKNNGVEAKNILMHITTGALGCCLGWKTDNPEYQAKNQVKLNKMQELYGSDVVGIIEKGPRAGGNAIHLDKIAISAATQHGLQHIEVDSICTSCNHNTYFCGQRTKRSTEIEQGYNNRNFVGITWK